MAASGNFLDGGSIQLFFGEEKMGVRNLVRQALLDKEHQL